MTTQPADRATASTLAPLAVALAILAALLLGLVVGLERLVDTVSRTAEPAPIVLDMPAEE